MALTDTGDRIDTLTGMNARAKDGIGGTVIIAASSEAIQDHGWGSIFDAASRKHAAGQAVSGSNPSLINITSEDF